MIPLALVPELEELLDRAITLLRQIPQVTAIVLGGSHARGFAHAASDLDLGIYYRAAQPLDIEAVRGVAVSLAKPGAEPVVTGLYGWGPWVNGGAWIQTPVTKIDFVYRSLDQVQQVLAEGRSGIWRHDYDQQPPYGFRSVVYFAETFYAIPLYDPEGALANLKTSVATYPPRLKEVIVQEGLWGAEFSLWSGARFAAAADVYNAAGCLTRAAQYLIHALFALNEEYFLNDKHVNRLLPGFAKCPPACAARLAEVLARPGATAEELLASFAGLGRLWMETVALTEGAYVQRFDLNAASLHD